GSSLMRVTVAGKSRSGCRLQIVGPTGPVADEAVRASRQDIDIPIVNYPNGRFHVVLQRQYDVLDHRTVRVRGGVAEASAEDGITIDPPPLSEQIRAMIEGGEGPTVE